MKTNICYLKLRSLQYCVKLKLVDFKISSAFSISFIHVSNLSLALKVYWFCKWCILTLCLKQGFWQQLIVLNVTQDVSFCPFLLSVVMWSLRTNHLFLDSTEKEKLGMAASRDFPSLQGFPPLLIKSPQTVETSTTTICRIWIRSPHSFTSRDVVSLSSARNLLSNIFSYNIHQGMLFLEMLYEKKLNRTKDRTKDHQMTR